MKSIRTILLLPLLAALSGCKWVVFDPSGDVAAQQGDLIVISTWLMLIVIVPVIALTIWFAWHYRQSNKKADYQPDWDHSIQLELVMWAIPLLIIICLGAVTWVSTHLLDPYRPIGRIDANTKITADAKPLNVEVVALDWKWLFIYPDYGIATVNELAAPINRPINFRITAESVMNSFFIPALAGQIYAMPGMETQLHAVLNKPGKFKGFSANYSGAGFSGMHFAFHGMTDADFDAWLATVKASSDTLNRNNYLTLAEPSENEPVHKYASVEKTLYTAILNMCVKPGTTCMHDMHRAEAPGKAENPHAHHEHEHHE